MAFIQSRLSEMADLKAKIAKKWHPRFFRTDEDRRKKRLKPCWRRPRGIDNKKQQAIKSHGAVVHIGYRTPNEIRGLHPIGLPERLVRNLAELEAARGCAVRIAGGVGLRKRNTMRLRAAELSIKLLN